MSGQAETLEPCERLRRKAEFERVYKEGRRIPAGLFIAFVLPLEAGPLRLGTVASRRVGNAVARSRAKRLLREAFRRNRPPHAVAADVVLVARPALIDACYRDVERSYVRSVGGLLEALGGDRG